MSTQAFKAILIREINQAMDRIDPEYSHDDRVHTAWSEGQLEAYAHILSLIQEPDL